MYRCVILVALFFPKMLLSQEAMWEVNPNAFEYSMSLTCVVLDQNEELINDSVLVGVFDSNVCVGVGYTDTYFSPIESNLGFVVVYGNSFTDNYTIKVIIDEVIYEGGILNFEANGIIGTLSDPHIIAPIFEGCTDLLALNYNPNAILDNGSCIDVIEGCTDASMLNYNAIANIDDGSCIPIYIGCYDSNYFEYDNYANFGDQELLCSTLIIYGCTDDCFVEYDPQSNIDDGSCNTSWHQAYLNLLNNSQNFSSAIEIDLSDGWSLIGYSKIEEENVEISVQCIVEKIIVIKDYLGDVYLPEWSFNGIGTFHPGLGYQIKLTEPVENFKFCE